MELAKITLGPHPERGDSSIVVCGFDLLKSKFFVTSIAVYASATKHTTARVEIWLHKLEAEGRVVIVPGDALRKLAEWSGFGLVPLSPPVAEPAATDE